MEKPEPSGSAPLKNTPSRPPPVEKRRRARFQSASEGTDATKLEKAADDPDVTILTEDACYEELYVTSLKDANPCLLAIVASPFLRGKSGQS